jgi:putative pyoverdin transport system ATP-binding/permease protein
MIIFDFIRDSGISNRYHFILVAGLASLMNAGVLVVVNTAAQSGYGSGSNLYLFFVFILTIAVYAFAQRRALRMASSDIETMVAEIRQRFLKRIRRCELLSIEGIGQARILTAMTADAQALSQSLSQAVMGVQAVMVTLFTGIYIFVLSNSAFFLWLLAITLSGVIISRQWARSQNLLARAAIRDGDFQDLSASLLHGFKEVKLSTKRSRAIFTDITDVINDVKAVRIDAQRGMDQSYVFGQVLFFMLIGTMVFLLPAIGNVKHDILEQVTTAVLFALGPVTMIIGTVPALSLAEAAAVKLKSLEKMLEAQIAAETPEAEQAVPVNAEIQNFETLEFQDVVFQYPDPEKSNGFVLGPLNFTVKRGETLFITGGNGAGKSTFLRLLTGLYNPVSGKILLNGTQVVADNAQDLRECIAAVFADYFLFKKLYGLTVTPEDASGWLEDMEIAEKASIAYGEFSTVQLSTGQRKRLALIASVLESKPVLVLDEWAADQDPRFRRKFYEVILPSLKKRGITIIGATHDDRWFDIADNQLHLADGQISQPRSQS